MSENKGFNELSKDNKGFNIQDEIKLDNYTDIYAPWQVKKRLRIWYEVEWDTNSGGWVFQKSYTITSPTATFDLIWCPFTPKGVNIRAYGTTSQWAWSDWIKTSTEQFTSWGNSGNTNTTISSLVFLRTNSPLTTLDASFNSWIPWGVRLNAVVSTATTVYLIATFYS